MLMGINTNGIGDTLLRHWGLTSSPLGIDCNKKGDL